MNIRHLYPPLSWSASSFVVDYSLKCVTCKNPMNIEVYVNAKDYDKFLHCMITYMTSKPINTYYNRKFFRRRRRVCYGCYKTSFSLNPFDREMGKRTIIYHSLSEDVLREWFQDFFDFCERKDVEDYICSNLTHCDIPEGMKIIIYK